MPQPKIDICKLYKEEYSAYRKPTLVNANLGLYLTIEGQGAPGSEAFTDRIGALYGVAYTVKRTRKSLGEQDYTIGKLEGQFWCEGEQCMATAPKEVWLWKLLIRTPDFVSQKDLDEAAAVLRKRGKGEYAGLVKLERLSEGDCVQMLHVGPYDKEPETISLMKAFAESKELALSGRHHEIYISDPRRVAPEKLKTILRLPVVPVAKAMVVQKAS